MSHPLNVKKDRALNWFRKYHKWPGLIFTFFIFLFSLSGIVLNHRGLFSALDISRKCLPAIYHYHNWNLAAIKSDLKLSDDSLLVYGNIGIWKTDSTFKTFRDFNKGFPAGTDNRKVFSLVQTANHRLLAGTLFGLYEYRAGWQKVLLPVAEERIVKVLEKGDSLLVMTRSNLLLANTSSPKLIFTSINMPAGDDYDNKVGLFKTLWIIHSGEIYGLAGKLLIDAVGLVFILITLTGFFYWLAPHLLKRVRDSSKQGIKKVNKFSLKWHNRLGSWALAVLLITVLTGMFLRPPLLIPIAYTRVAKIRFSELDNPNPWFDRLRDILYDESLKRFVVATSEGVYYTDDNFGSVLRKYPVQPPLSIMGITVMEQVAHGEYLLGSFSGIFRWVPAKQIIQDYFTKLPADPYQAGGPPFGALAVSGFIGQSNGGGIIFDYAAGAIPLQTTVNFPQMPQAVISRSPVSLWNTALEIHTGRIFEFMIGSFYILIVPLTGIAMLLILVAGFFSWYIPYRRKAKGAKSLP